MKRKLLWFLFIWLFSFVFWFLWLQSAVYADWVECWGECKNWIKLNTCFPFIWDCIVTKSGDWAGVNVTNAFPTMTSALIKLTMSIILVVCFILIIVAGIMRSANKPKEAKKLISWVAITILLLWFAWVILRLINPNFFK